MKFRTKITENIKYKEFKSFFINCSQQEMKDIQKDLSQEKEYKFRTNKGNLYGNLERELPDRYFKILLENEKSLQYKYSYIIMRYMGLRVGEVTNIRVCDIIEDKYLRIKTLKQKKNKRTDIIRIPKSIKTEVLNYINVNKMFGSYKNEFEKIFKLTTKSIRKRFRESTIKLNINKIYDKSEERIKIDKKGRKRSSRTLYLYTTHSLRHKFCNWVDEVVPNRRMTQALMRHSTLRSTETYFKNLIKEANIVLAEL